MNSYYQSLLQTIQSNLDNEEYEKALQLIEAELRLPYVPQEELEVLQAYKDECLFHQNKPVANPDLDALIHGSFEAQEKAVSLLKDMNLRLMQDEVQTLLDSEHLLDEIKGELIESLMEQKIETPYHIKKSGLEFTFVPSVIIPSAEDSTLLEIRLYFDKWFSNDNPTYLRFCNRLLDQEILENRPMDFMDCEAIAIAKAIVRFVCEAFGQSDAFFSFEKDKKIENVVEYPLLIERRGENHE